MTKFQEISEKILTLDKFQSERALNFLVGRTAFLIENNRDVYQAWQDTLNYVDDPRELEH